MTTAIAPPPVLPAPRVNAVAGATVAELLDRLGGIPPSRVRMSPPPGTATKADAIHSAEWYGALCELVDATLVEKPIGLYESGVAQTVGLAIGMYNASRRPGLVGGEAGMFSVVRDQVRMPDVSFTRWERIPTDYPRNPAPDVSPDLAVEVLSPSNTAREIERKLENYFAGGSRLVWVFDPPSRTVAVVTAAQRNPTVLTDADTLEGGAVLPGFTLSVREAFDAALPPAQQR